MDPGLQQGRPEPQVPHLPRRRWLLGRMSFKLPTLYETIVHEFCYVHLAFSRGYTGMNSCSQADGCLEMRRGHPPVPDNRHEA